MTDHLVPWALLQAEDVRTVTNMALGLRTTVCVTAWDLTRPDRRHLLAVVDDPGPQLVDGAWIIDPPTLVCKVPQVCADCHARLVADDELTSGLCMRCLWGEP